MGGGGGGGMGTGDGKGKTLPWDHLFGPMSTASTTPLAGTLAPSRLMVPSKTARQLDPGSTAAGSGGEAATRGEAPAVSAPVRPSDDGVAWKVVAHGEKKDRGGCDREAVRGEIVKRKENRGDGDHERAVDGFGLGGYFH